MAYVAGFIVGLLLLRRLVRTGRLKLTSDHVEILITYILIGVLAGGRVGYVLFYDLSLLFDFSLQFPFWGLIAVNEGGMSSHGGFVGVTLMLVLFCRKYRVPLFHLGDAVVSCAAPGLFFGRMANFINGELFGRPTDVPWAVCFPTEIMNWSTERILKLSAFLESKGYHYKNLLRLIQDIRTNDRVAELVHPFLTPRHPSQIYEALLEGIVLFLILWIIMNRSRIAGLASAGFFIFYAILRITAEMFRQPDYGIGYQWLGLTRGQWLSVAMIVGGCVILYISSKKQILVKNITTPPKPAKKENQEKKHRHRKKK